MLTLLYTYKNLIPTTWQQSTSQLSAGTSTHIAGADNVPRYPKAFGLWKGWCSFQICLGHTSAIFYFLLQIQVFPDQQHISLNLTEGMLCYRHRITWLLLNLQILQKHGHNQYNTCNIQPKNTSAMTLNLKAMLHCTASLTLAAQTWTLQLIQSML